MPPMGCTATAMLPLAVAPAEAVSGRKSRALMMYPESGVLFHPLCGSVFHSVIGHCKLGQLRSHGFHSHTIISRRCGDLQHFSEIMVSPDPGAFCEQFVVDKDAINWCETFPVAVDIKQGFDEHSIVHTVFMGGLCHLISLDFYFLALTLSGACRGRLTGYWLQAVALPWPASVKKAVLAETCPVGHEQTAMPSLPRTQFQLKQLELLSPRLRLEAQVCTTAFCFQGNELKLLASCG